MTIAELQEKARQMRIDEIKMIAEAGSGHPGGSLSVTDILVALYYSKMNTSPDAKPGEHDVCVLSKGHTAPALYAILADKGYFPKEDLWTLRKMGSHLQGHPDSAKLAGVDCSTGSLGQGASVAVGMARGYKIQGKPYQVYCVNGDGELQEGICWEAFMAAAQYKLDNLTVIVDRNGLQIDGRVDDVMSLSDLAGKFTAFGFAVDTIDGHSYEALLAALESRQVADYIADKYDGAVISVVIIKSGLEMLTDTLDDILGRRYDRDEMDEIRATIAEDEAVMGVYDLILHAYGPNRQLGSVHVEVPDTMTAEEIDVMERRIAHHVYEKHGILMTSISIYAMNTTNDEARSVRSKVTEIVMGFEGVLQMHAFRVDLEKKCIIFDLVLDFDVKDRSATFEAIRAAVASAYPDYTPCITLDIDF